MKLARYYGLRGHEIPCPRPIVQTGEMVCGIGQIEAESGGLRKRSPQFTAIAPELKRWSLYGMGLGRGYLLPKSSLDWLSIVSLWIGAIIMAIHAGGAPLMAWAPYWFASQLWSYAPALLVSFYAIVAIYRRIRPVTEQALPTPLPLPAPMPAPIRSSAVEPAPATTRIQRNERSMSQNRPFIIHNMDTVRLSAGMSYNRTPREAEKEWPRMHAALLSANKEFGIPMPPVGMGALIDLECGKRFLEQIIPLLRAGHDAEAREAAEKFINRLKPRGE